MIQQLINGIKKHSQAQGNDRIRIGVYHLGLKFIIFQPFTDMASLTVESLKQEIEEVLQSNDDFKINDGYMGLKATHTSRYMDVEERIIPWTELPPVWERAADLACHL